MSGFIVAVANLRTDLLAAGVSRTRTVPTLFTYIRALHEGSDLAWRAFYRSVHDRLRELADRDYPYAGRGALPLLRLLDDDLGAKVISEEERARIRARLVEYGPREASLPS
jgi:hypothetical protein